MTKMTVGSSALIKVEATAPSKTDSTNNKRTTTTAGQELRTLHGAYRSQAEGQASWHLLPHQVPETPDPYIRL